MQVNSSTHNQSYSTQVQSQSQKQDVNAQKQQQQQATKTQTEDAPSAAEGLAKLQKTAVVNGDENMLVLANMQTLSGVQTGPADRKAAGVNVRI